MAAGDFAALRIQDPGALQWSLEHTEIPLQWIVETGTHNLLGLKKWVELTGRRLDRLVLSLQIPRSRLRQYGQELKVPLEILGIGPILLFYTPRHLLEQFGSAELREIRLLATSRESAHKDFPVLSNAHGTFLFHQKHHWLLEYAEELAEMGIGHVRLELPVGDLRDQALELLRKKNPTSHVLEQFKAVYPTSLIRGFYHSNKSQGLFSKLKNEVLEKLRQEAVGQVIGVEKGCYLGVELGGKVPLEVGREYFIQTPEGKRIPFTLRILKHPDLSCATQLSSGLALVGYVKGAGPKGLIMATT